MNASQTGLVLQKLSDSWPARPLSPASQAVYAQHLAGFDYKLVVEAIDTLIDSTQWLPSIAEIRLTILHRHPKLPPTVDEIRARDAAGVLPPAVAEARARDAAAAARRNGT